MLFSSLNGSSLSPPSRLREHFRKWSRNNVRSIGVLQNSIMAVREPAHSHENTAALATPVGSDF